MGDGAMCMLLTTDAVDMSGLEAMLNQTQWDL